MPSPVNSPLIVCLIGSVRAAGEGSPNGALTSPVKHLTLSGKVMTFGCAVVRQVMTDRLIMMVIDIAAGKLPNPGSGRGLCV